MTELLLLALAGLLVGAGMAAARRGAPVALRRGLYVLGGVVLVLAVLALAGVGPGTG